MPNHVLAPAIAKLVYSKYNDVLIRTTKFI